MAVEAGGQARWPIVAALALGLVTSAVIAFGSVTASGGAESLLDPSEEPRVACWNRYFPFESEPPLFLTAPPRCSWYRRKAETYAEGALLGTKLSWTWGVHRAIAVGRVKVPGIGRDFGPGRVRLLDPVQSCGRTVFSRLEYSMRDSQGRLTGGYPIYTCRSDPG